MRTLILGDYTTNNNKQELIAEIARDFNIKQKQVKEFEIVIAYKKINFDAASIFLLLKQNDQFYEVQAEHWETDTFEDLFEPSLCSLELLKSDEFCMLVSDEYVDDIREFLKKL